jgi:hypothetical protein
MVKDDKNPPQDDEDAADGSTGSLFDADEGGAGTSGGGQAGKIAFHYKDAMEAPKRDDTLPPNEIRRLQFVHNDEHRVKVKKQMQIRNDRESRKEGSPAIRVPAQYQQGYGGGGGVSRFKKHPVSDKFRGMADPQVNAIPNLNDSQTNSELKDRLENQLQNKFRNTPKFNPRPRPV